MTALISSLEKLAANRDPYDRMAAITALHNSRNRE